MQATANDGTKRSTAETKVVGATTEGAADTLLRAAGVYSIYEGKEGSANVVALSGVDLSIDAGEFVSIVGPSGSGKSSLMRILGGLQAPSAGHIYYHGEDITKLSEEALVPFRRSTVGYVFQEGNLFPMISAYQNVVQTMRFAGRPKREAKRRAEELMELLGIAPRMHALPTHLSGGERQRVAIARALANEPEIILADEPTGNLDYENAEHVMAVMIELRQRLNIACLIVTHSKHVASFTDRSLELRDGVIIGEHGTDLDLESLVASRRVVVNPRGTLTFPPELHEMLKPYGRLWEFRFERDEEAGPRLIGSPIAGSESAAPRGGAVRRCPVCNTPAQSGDFQCRACGATLRK